MTALPSSFPPHHALRVALCRTRAFGACLALACLLLTSGCGTPDAPPAGEDLAVAAPFPASASFTCDTTALPLGVGPLPNTPDFDGTTGTVASLQCHFDVFSWNSFLALNLGTDGAVWQDWPESSDIFLAGGASIPVWSTGGAPPDHQSPDICPGDGGLPLKQLAKHPDLLEESTEPFDSGPLVDVNGNYSRFAIFVNRDMYDYIQANTLYSKAGQGTFLRANTVNFPCGCNYDSSDPASCPQAGVEGAVMIKTAWRLLTDADDPDRFHTMESAVYTPAVGDDPATCTSQQVGLVGFHIGHKTQGSPQWIWSTFEHVNNAPTQGAPVDPSRQYSYYDADCTDCPAVNTPPPQPWNPHLEPVGPAGRSQVERVVPITQATDDLNAAVQPLLAGTPWANYELISTQWPFDANGSASTPASRATNWCTALNPSDKAGAPRPLFLANTTLETYIQGTTPQASSSCINCHLNAATAVTVGTNNFSDFTYLLERAK